MSDKLKFRDGLFGLARLTEEVARKTASGTGNALNLATKFVRSHQGSISNSTSTALDAGGKAMSRASGALAVKAGELSRFAKSADNGSSAKRLGGLGVVGLTAVAKATRKIGEATSKAAPVIGGATGSAVTGLFGTVSGAIDSVGITDRHFVELRAKLERASCSYRRQSAEMQRKISAAQRARRKKDLVDLLTIGGISLAAILSHGASVPPNVEQAFQLAYPGLAANGETFAEAVARVDSEGLMGLMSGVKGKLFELEFVDHLNNEVLTDGVVASLATSATQPGWDIQILDANETTLDLLQAKATQSAAYVQDALARYPDIDVTTTSEVYAELIGQGFGSNVIDSGISALSLESQIEAAVNQGETFEAMDLVPGGLGLAIVGLSTFMDKGLTPEERGVEFGDRAAKLGVTGVAANTALIATNTWWLALAVGVGSTYLTSFGRHKRQRYDALREIIAHLESKAGSSIPLLLTNPI